MDEQSEREELVGTLDLVASAQPMEASSSGADSTPAQDDAAAIFLHANIRGTANELGSRGVPLTSYRIQVEGRATSWTVLR